MSVLKRLFFSVSRILIKWFQINWIQHKFICFSQKHSVLILCTCNSAKSARVYSWRHECTDFYTVKCWFWSLHISNTFIPRKSCFLTFKTMYYVDQGKEIGWWLATVYWVSFFLSPKFCELQLLGIIHQFLNLRASIIDLSQSSVSSDNFYLTRISRQHSWLCTAFPPMLKIKYWTRFWLRLSSRTLLVWKFIRYLYNDSKIIISCSTKV